MPEMTCFMFFLHGIVPLFNYNKAQQDYVIEVLTLVIEKSIKYAAGH